MGIGVEMGGDMKWTEIPGEVGEVLAEEERDIEFGLHLNLTAEIAF